MSGHTYHIHTHTYIYTHDNYYNPRCANAHRGLISINTIKICIPLICLSVNSCVPIFCYVVDDSSVVSTINPKIWGKSKPKIEPVSTLFFIFKESMNTSNLILHNR